MWEALCVSARMWAAQAEKVWRDRRQSSQRTRFRPDSHKPAGVESQTSCWNVSKTARQRVLIDNNLVQTFLRSVLCNPLFRGYCLKCDFGGVGKTKGRTCAFGTTAQATEGLFYHCSWLISRSTHDVGQRGMGGSESCVDLEPIRSRPIPLRRSRSVLSQSPHGRVLFCFLLSLFLIAVMEVN